MRTAILLGFIISADSICQSQGMLSAGYSDLSIKVIGTILVIGMIMDVLEFFKTMSKD